jgi:hypothetical protein
MSELKSQTELHGAWVRLHVGDLPELATELVNQVRSSVRIRRQAPISVGNAQILMVERIEKIPSELYVARFAEIHFLAQ